MIFFFIGFGVVSRNTCCFSDVDVDPYALAPVVTELGRVVVYADFKGGSLRGTYDDRADFALEDIGADPIHEREGAHAGKSESRWSRHRAIAAGVKLRNAVLDLCAVRFDTQNRASPNGADIGHAIADREIWRESQDKSWTTAWRVPNIE